MSNYFQNWKRQALCLLKNTFFCGLCILNVIHLHVVLALVTCLLNGLTWISDFPVLFRLASILSLFNCCASFYWCFNNGCFKEYELRNSSVLDFYSFLSLCTTVGVILGSLLVTVVFHSLNFILTFISPATLVIGFVVIGFGCFLVGFFVIYGYSFCVYLIMSCVATCQRLRTTPPIPIQIKVEK